MGFTSRGREAGSELTRARVQGWHEPGASWTETVSLSGTVHPSQKGQQERRAKDPSRAGGVWGTYTRAPPLRPVHPTGGRGQLYCCLATALQRPGPVLPVLVSACS